MTGPNTTYLQQMLGESGDSLPLNLPPGSIKTESIIGELKVNQIDMDALVIELKKRLGL